MMQTAVDCDCPDKMARNTSLVEALTGLGALTALLLTLINQISPEIVAAIVGFRIRIIVLVALALALLTAATLVVFLKHTPKRDQKKHYSYPRPQRLRAKFAFIPLLILFLISVYSLRFLRGHNGSVQGLVLGPNNIPVTGAKVDVVNLDRESVCARIAETDSLGRFVVDVISSPKGRPVYWSITCPSESVPRFEKFEGKLVDGLARTEVPNETPAVGDEVVLNLACPNPK